MWACLDWSAKAPSQSCRCVSRVHLWPGRASIALDKLGRPRYLHALARDRIRDVVEHGRDWMGSTQMEKTQEKTV